MINRSKMLRPVNLVVPGLLAVSAQFFAHGTGGGDGQNLGFNASIFGWTGPTDPTANTRARWNNSGGNGRYVKKYGAAWYWAGSYITLADTTAENVTVLEFDWTADVTDYYDFYTAVWDVVADENYAHNWGYALQ
jgi:hypothetical protein